jgi:crotonobetainyl-CoA:carnitine CoA-transferase CaiB-like acyl-CoA transferase
MPPLGGTLRNMIPFGYFFREQSTSFIRPNPNKYWLGLDLHKPEAQEVFPELAAEIVIESME